MANFVKCKFTFIGNKLIDDLVIEMNKRITDDIQIHSDYADTSRVGRIFYGLTGQDAILGFDELGSKWIHDDQDYVGLGFVGGWDPVRGFQDHLLRHASKLDPKLIILMEYEDESPNFVGARYVLMKNGEIAEYEYELDMTDTLVAYDSDYDEATSNNNETKEYREVILWEDVSDKIAVCKEIAFREIKEDNPWIPKKYLERNPNEHCFF
ncbi:hypothetical protein [Polynucleobacter sp. AP-Titi-500A-B4]|uniref:hypothetical protein n=1 Tax=Polynucleobacter sp. AP-Titi-500A-B4 TaxID=2576923 RepID=UPI001BFDCE65|nr:hypothetical protein [Polynucleobacter sp. AP-Titi-500A-B4]QWE12493.1 hypothetical protein FD968_10395 [Polynucleobacter sp. AP-Titi-500A-B4]